MPHGKRCPHCKKKAWDWFLEWYLPAERTAIFKGQAAMDCPWCREPVRYQNDDILPASSDLPVHRRDLDQATKYAKIKNYSSLEEFLLSPLERRIAAPFRLGYWAQVDLPFRKSKP